MLRRTLIAALVCAAGIGLAPSPSAVAGSNAPPGADKLKPIIQKLYGKTDFQGDSIARGQAVNDLQALLLKEKDKKNSALKFTSWWSDQILEALYGNDKWVMVKTAKIKDVVIGEFESYPKGAAGDKSVKGPYAYRGPNGYSPKKPCPLLISIVDSKTDPKEYLKKNWEAFPDVAKEWLLACVAESDVFDLKKDPLAAVRVLRPLLLSYNVDPNRIFLEGVGSACTTAQKVASYTLPDRLAALVLRNPAEYAACENIGLFPTVVVHGPEGAEKAMAVLAKVKETFGEDHGIELAAPDVASVEGPCAALSDWLSAAKPRELAHEYSWTATFDRENNCTNPWTGSVYILSPAKREEPTTFTVNFRKAENAVDITNAKNLGEFVICMNDDLLDLDREVAVFVNTVQVENKVFDRRVDDMLTHADTVVEYGHLFPAQCRKFVPAPPAPAPAPGDKKDGDGKDAPGDKPSDKKDGEKK